MENTKSTEGVVLNGKPWGNQRQYTIKYTIDHYETSYHKCMLIGHCESITMVTSFRNFSWITPMSLRFAKWRLERRFKALLL